MAWLYLAISNFKSINDMLYLPPSISKHISVWKGPSISFAQQQSVSNSFENAMLEHECMFERRQKPNLTFLNLLCLIRCNMHCNIDLTLQKSQVLQQRDLSTSLAHHLNSHYSS